MTYIVDKASSKGWQGETGYITKDLLARTMPPPSADSLVLVCGPPPMMAALSGDKAKDKSQGPLTGMLKDMGCGRGRGVGGAGLERGLWLSPAMLLLRPISPHLAPCPPPRSYDESNVFKF